MEVALHLVMALRNIQCYLAPGGSWLSLPSSAEVHLVQDLRMVGSTHLWQVTKPVMFTVDGS